MGKVHISLLLTLFLISNPYLINAGENDTLSKQSQTLQNYKSLSLPSFELSYIADLAHNFSGGIQTGSAYLGMVNFRATIGTEHARLWKGGQLFINIVNIHSTRSFSELIGDIQVASNIDAGNHTYFQELWFKQVIGSFEFTAGLQDLNVEFLASDYGSLYLNSSFGILPIISGNVCAPIFPLTTLGFTAKWKISGKAVWLAAVYDGCPVPFEDNPSNLNWSYQRNDGILSISELQYNTTINNLSGTHKLGAFSYKNDLFNRLQPDNMTRSDVFGFYLLSDQQLWNSDNRSLGAFIQAGVSPLKSNEHNTYVGFGLNLEGTFTKKQDDNLGIAFGCVNPEIKTSSKKEDGTVKSNKRETTIELTYSYSITENFFLQPDFQYIINPSGSSQTLKNSLAGILRLSIIL